MGNRIGRHLTLASLTLLVALACGGRSLKEVDGSAGESGVAGAQNSFAGAQNTFAGAPSSAGATQSYGGSDTGDCTVLPTGCCGAFEPVDASQLVAVSTAHVAEYEKAHCPDIIPCPASLPETEYAKTQKYFRAICFHPLNLPAQCQLLDVRGTPFSSCVTTSECRLREGVACCPECDGQGWVPVNTTINFCSVSIPCGHCVSFPPAGLQTSCQAGTCRFVPPPRGIISRECRRAPGVASTETENLT